MTTLSLTQAMTAYTQSMAHEGKAACTVAIYQHDLQRLASLLGALRRPVPLDRVTPDQLQVAVTDPQWLLLPDGQPCRAATIARRLAAVRAFFRWTCHVGLLCTNPAVMLTTPRIVRPAPGILTDADVHQVRAILAAASGWLARRDQVLLECFLSVGLQLHEVVALTLEDLDLVANRLRVGTGEKYLNRELRTALAAYLPWRQAQTAVTTRALLLSQLGVALSSRSVACRVEYWCRRAGLPAGLSPKSLRYTFAVRVYQARPDLRLVQQALGYKDIRTAAVYAVLMEGELEAVMEGL